MDAFDVNASGTRRLLAHRDWRVNNTLAVQTDAFGGAITPHHDWDGALRTMSVARGGAVQWEQSVDRDASTRWPTSVTTAPHDRAADTATITHDLSGRLSHVTNPKLSYDLVLTRDASNLARTGHIVQSAPGALARDVTPEYRVGGSPAGPDPGAITGLRRPDGSLAVTNAFDPNGTVTSRTDGTSSSTMRVDENGRVFERGDNRYFYGAMGDRTHVFDASKDRVIAQVGLLDIEYKRVGNALIRLRTEFIVPGGNVPLARVNESNNAVAFLHTDVQGSVAYVRGSTAGVDVRFDYTPFGEVLSARATGGASVERELRRFQGGLVDPSGAGYLQFGARLYDPVTQQWASADPAFHSYAYGFVGDSPYLRADPSGLDDIPRQEMPWRGGASTAGVTTYTNGQTGPSAVEVHSAGVGAWVWPFHLPVLPGQHPMEIAERRLDIENSIEPVPAFVQRTHEAAEAVDRIPAGGQYTTVGLYLSGVGTGLRLPGHFWTMATGYNTSGRIASDGETVESGATVGATVASVVTEGATAGWTALRAGTNSMRAGVRAWITRSRSGSMVTLYHGHQQPLVGGAFNLEVAAALRRRGTPSAGVHLTDDSRRAIGQHGHGGYVSRVRVPSHIAAEMYQQSPILGPRRTPQFEWVATTEEQIEHLNSSMTTLPASAALRRWGGR
ncbi:MAG: RHS repeat-associated core domain-containing protein [Deltaproteobacteria bacterium]|nr:RHS repeat-associated core domain-containing protein [Deltaproteobacteria bacterium]